MKNKRILATMIAGFMLTMSIYSPVWAEEEIEGPGAAMDTSLQAPPHPAFGPGAALGGEGVAGSLAPFMDQQLSSPIVPIVEKYSFEQMEQDIQKLQSTYGNLMQTNVIGTSADGRSIYEIVIGNQNAGKHVMIQGGIHAREYMTPLLVMRQMEYALAFYHSGTYAGQSLAGMFDQVAVHFIPMSNPDGIGISQFGLSSIRSEELKQNIIANYEIDKAEGRTSATLERYLIYWKANARGVDLNLNFDAGWNEIPGVTHPSYAGYKGTAPLSEPESAALAALGNQRTWAAVINYHSMGQIIYWDYAVNNTRDKSAQLAQKIIETTGYRLAASSGGGGYKDWIQSKENPAPSVTVEVGKVACPLPLSEFESVWAQNKSVWALTMYFAMTH